MSHHGRCPCVHTAPKGNRKDALLRAGCLASKVHRLRGRQGHLLSRVSTRGPRWWNTSTTKVGPLRLLGGILLDDTYPLHLWQGRSKREELRSREAVGSPAGEPGPAFVPCPARGHSTSIVPGLPGKMGGVPCEIFPYSKTASELGSEGGTTQTFKKKKIHTHPPAKQYPQCAEGKGDP